MYWRDIYLQNSTTQTTLQSTAALASWNTGITSDYRSYNPANSKYAAVAATRSGNFDPQRSFANLKGAGRYTTYYQGLSNSSSPTTDNGYRLSYLVPSASRPNNYFWNQHFTYSDPTKANFSNQTTAGLSFYRLSDSNKVVLDQFANTSMNWLWYNNIDLDNNLITLSNAGAVSKIEGSSYYQDNTTNPTTPLLFQTHGGIGANNTSTWRTDYPRDSWSQIDDRETYIIYHPNFGSNVQLPTSVELEGEWWSNATGGRSGS